MICDLKSSLDLPSRVPIMVNGVPIDHDVISREAQHHPAPSPHQAWQQAARALLVRELLLQEAQRQGLRAEPLSDGSGRSESDDEALIRTLIDLEVKTPEPDEKTCRRYYERNLARFCSSDLYEVSHILIAARCDQPQEFSAACEIANTLISTLLKNPSLFAEFAATHSACPSAKTGGHLGQITQGDTTSEFEAALSALDEGEMTEDPIKTRYGVHIIWLHRKIESQVLPFRTVYEHIAAYLTEKSRRAGTAQYLARLASRADITGIDLPTPADLRVY